MKIKDLSGQTLMRGVDETVKKRTVTKKKKKVPEVCRNLRRLRKERKLTQQELADSLDYCRELISRLENGKTIPSRRQVSLFSRFYEVSVLEINPEFEIIKDNLSFP